MTRSTVWAPFLLLLAAVPPAAQEPAVPPAAPEPAAPDAAAKARALLQKAVERMAGLPGYAFSGKVDTGMEDEEGQNPIRMLGLGAPLIGTRIEGSWRQDGLVAFRLDETTEGALRAGLMVYKGAGDAWRPRLAVGPAGESLWWCPDPGRLLQELLASGAPATVDRSEILDQRPLRVIKVEVGEQAATDLLLCGLAPDPGKVPDVIRRSGNSFSISSSGGGRGLPKDLKYVAELWVDSSTGLVHALHLTGTVPRGQGGNVAGMVIQLGGQGGGRLLPQEEEDEKRPKVKTVALRLRFADHGQAPAAPPREAALRLGLNPEPAPEARREI